MNYLEPLKKTFGVKFQKNLMEIAGSGRYVQATDYTGNRSKRWIDSHKLNLDFINEERSRWCNPEDYSNIQYNIQKLNDNIQTNRELQKQELEHLLSKENRDTFYSRIVTTFGLDFSSHIAKTVAEKKNWVAGRENEYRGKIKQGLLFDHMNHYVTLFLPSYSHSKLVRITINKKDKVNKNSHLTGVEMTRIVVETLGEPHFVERSIAFDETIILYYLFDKYIPDAKRKALESFFYCMYNFKVSLSRKDTLKYEIVPFSKTFPEFGTYEPDDPFTVVNQKGIEESLSILESAQPIHYNKVAQITKGIIETEELLLEKNNINTLSEEYAYTKFSFGAGTRFSTLPKLAMWAVGNNYTFERYVEIVYKCHDGTSKDMNTWSEKAIEKELQRCYDFAQRHVASMKDTYLTKDEEDDWKNHEPILYRSTQQTDYSLTMIILFRDIVALEFARQYPNLQNTKWQKNMVSDAEKILNFIIEKKKYDELREKRYVKRELESLNGSIPIPTSLYKNLSTQLNLKSDVSKIMRVLVNSGILKRVRANNKSYSFGKTRFCYHYVYEMSIHHLSSILSSYYDIRCSVYESKEIGSTNYVNYVLDFSNEIVPEQRLDRPPD